MSDDSPPVSYDFEVKGGESTLIKKCNEYWRSISSIVSKSEREKDDVRFRNQLTATRGLSIALVRAIFDETALQIIWEAANNCDILHVVTDLVDFPWEAIVNPWADADRQFLVQKCAVIRKARLNYVRQAPVNEPIAPSDLLFMVDAELEGFPIILQCSRHV